MRSRFFILFYFASIAFLASCGGGGGSGSATSASATPPTVTGIAPGSGVRGATVLIQGTHLANPGSVQFNGADASDFAAEGDSQIRATVPLTATTGKVSVATAWGTATSAENFTVDPSPVPTISGFAPGSGPVGTAVLLGGTGLLGTVSVEFNGVPASSFAVLGDTQVRASVPAGATTGTVRVTTPGGTAATAGPFTVTASAAVDLAIENVYITQATQGYPDATVPLVKDRSAWVRVFVTADVANNARPPVRVRFVNGATTETLTIAAPGPGVPASVDEGDDRASWNAPVPAAWLREGVTVTAEVDPAWAVAEADRSNNVYPPGGAPLPLDVRAVDPLRITLVPVTTGDGLTGNVNPSNLASYTDLARRLYPVPDAVDAAVGTGLSSSVRSLGADGSGWSQLLSEVSAKRYAEGAPDRNYYGVVKVGYGSGVAGLGCLGCPIAVGWDRSDPGRVLAHELGHNFGRPHSPGCGATGIDPNYPTAWNYANGYIGVTGWDAFAGSNNLKAAARYNDIMNYCSVQWISDYVYGKVLEFRGGGAPVAQAMAAGGPQEGLLVWGRVVGGQLVLEPALPVTAPASVPGRGDYTLEAGDAQGRVMASVPFGAETVEDLPGPEVRLFSIVLSYRAPERAQIHTLRVTRAGRELARTVRRASGMLREDAAADPVALRRASEPGDELALSWDAGRHPLVVVRDGGTGEILAFHRGGLGRMKAPPGRDLEIVACDGIDARVQRHPASIR